MQRLEGLLRKAVQDYEMIAPGDRVCVGVSGGKDSVALTVALGHLRRYLGVPFEVMAVTLDPRFGGVEADYQPLADLFAQEGIPYEIRRTDIGPVVFDYRKEPNPCALCAKMRPLCRAGTQRAGTKTPARCVPKCGAGHCTLPRRNLAATKWRWGTTWMMPWRLFT